jgi:hypothetical protein
MIQTVGISQNGVPDADSAEPACCDSPRSAPRRRRRWLRELDSPLGREFEDAGALSCAELVELSAEPLRRCASPQTIEEWWQYAYRRGWLEDHGYECCRLTEFGRAELRDRRERDAWPEPGSIGRAILRWLLPAGAAGASAVYLSGRLPDLVVVIVAAAIVLGIGLIVVSPLSRWLDRVVEGQAARRACHWLDDRPVRLAKYGANQAVRATRLYGVGDPSAPGSDRPERRRPQPC